MKKKSSVLFLITFAISLTFLCSQNLQPCSISYQRVGPVFKKGKLYGLRIYGFHRDNIIRYAGFRKNDIILEVNEFKIGELIGDGNLDQFSTLKREFKKSNHLKFKFLRKKLFYKLEITLNRENISRIEDSHCTGYTIDQSIPKKEMFDFYEMKEIE